MTPPVSLINAIGHFSPLAGKAAKRFAGQPTLFQVACDLVGKALKRLDPNHAVKPWNVAMGWPAEATTAGEDFYMLLPDLLIDLYVRNTGLTVVPHYQRLLKREHGQWVPLALDVSRLAQELDALMPSLADAFKQALLAFWSEAGSDGKTHWAWMSDYLHEAFVRAIEEARQANALVPLAYQAAVTVGGHRQSWTLTETRPVRTFGAYLVQLERNGLALPYDARLDPHLVITLNGLKMPQPYLTFSVNTGVRYFDSSTAMLDAFKAKLHEDEVFENVNVQLVSIQGDVFDALARMWLQTQLIQVTGITAWVRRLPDVLAAERLKMITEALTSSFELDARIQASEVHALQQALPGWLQRAPAADRWHFAGALARVALAQSRGVQGWFLDGVPTLESFALNQLREAAAALHPEAPALDPDNIVATLETVTVDLIAITGGPSNPQFHEQPVSVVDLMIDNLAAHSAGRLKVVPKAGTTLPPWLDGDALKALVRHADVGRTYPQLLRETLLDGPQATEREALFAAQVVRQLPLLAWELLMRGEAGIDRLGYRLVDVGLGGTPSNDGFRLMRLGVTAGPAYGTDEIAATYVFVDQNNAGNACVLYRPLHEQPLRQFLSLDALWEEVTAPGVLQDEIVSWMTESGRTRYSHGGLRQPRVTRFGQGDEYAPLSTPSPARPVLTPLQTPLLHTLYREIVSALINKAEQRSVSNQEDNWLALGKLAWTLFNSVLPIVSGPLATAGWLIQLSEQFATFLQANEQPGRSAIEARNDLLFTVIILLMSEAVHWPINEPRPLPGEPGKPDEAGGQVRAVPAEHTLPESASKPSKVTSAPHALTAVLSAHPVDDTGAIGRSEGLDLSWSSATLALNTEQQAALVQLRAKPPLINLSPIPHGPTRGLYLNDNRLLLEWQGHFYAIEVAGQAFRITGPKGEPGPFIRRDEAGRWQLDLRLRLKGGGPNRRIEARRQENARIRLQGEQQFQQVLRHFEQLRERVNQIVDQLDQAQAANEPLLPLREVYDKELREGYEACAQEVSAYQRLNESTPLIDFAEHTCLLLSRLLTVSKAITDNLSLMTAEFVEGSRYAAAAGQELVALINADPKGWATFIDRFDSLAQHAIKYSQAHEEVIRQLEKYPGLGRRTLEDVKDAVPLVQSVTDLRASLTYCHVSFIVDGLSDSPMLAEQTEDALEPLMVHATSHAGALDDSSLEPTQVIGVLDTAISHYQRVEDALQRFEQILPAYYQGSVAKLKVVTLALREDAEKQMSALVRETASEPVPTASRSNRRPKSKAVKARKQGNGSKRPTPGSSQAQEEPAQPPALEDLQVIQTTQGETVFARVEAQADAGVKTATVTSGGRVVARWQEDAQTGLWKKQPDTAPRRPAAKVSLNRLIRNADAALAQAEQDTQRLRQWKQRTKVPADIEDLYHGHAKRLVQLAEQIEGGLTASNLTDTLTEDGSAELKARQLREQAQQLKTLGTQARIDVSKSLMPTEGRVKFLKDAGEVTIHRVGERTPLGRGGRRDYVQEYEIRDSQHVLWYAHFHYDTAEAPPERYTAAHLKTVTQRFDGYQKQLQQARNDQEVVSIYRSQITPALASQLFLSLP